MNPADELAQFRPDLLRFARLQLRDDQLAEDVVQEAMIGALAGMQDFSGRSALKTWVFAILKNKIIDALRSRERTVNLSALTEEEEEFEQTFDRLFKANGHWSPAARPGDWGDPEETLEQAQFWTIFDACLNHLQQNTARVFMMREFLDFEVEEICTELGISSSNCYVILHRARHGLRGCLERTWFGPGDRPC
ncbi:MAG: sigma-70 family RNA polymerase sigma factor [Pseudomonadota bacterium]